MGEAQQENMFGKIRGRWREEQAQEAVRDLPDIALSNIACMDSQVMTAFIEKFNKLFEHTGPWPLGPLRIVVQSRQSTRAASAADGRA